MAPPRNPSRVREAKPYGLALDCSLAVAKTSLCQLGEWIQSLSAKGDIFTRLTRGTFLFGYDRLRAFACELPREELGLERCDFHVESSFYSHFRPYCAVRIRPIRGWEPEPVLPGARPDLLLVQPRPRFGQDDQTRGPEPAELAPAVA